MARIEQFQDIEAWQHARLLARETYRCCRETRLGRDFGLRDQIQRAAISIMANIAEGFGRGRNAEFAHFLKIAKGSCAELQSHLYVALDAELIDETTFEGLQSHATMTGRKITGFISYLKSASKP